MPATTAQLDRLIAEQSERDRQHHAALTLPLYYSVEGHTNRAATPAPARPILDADIATPPDGFSGAPAPGPATFLGLAVPYSQWSTPHTAHHPSLSADGLPCLSWLRPGCHRDMLQHVAAGSLVIPLIINHGQGPHGREELATTADGSLRLWPATTGLMFTIHARDASHAAHLDRMRRAFPHVSPGSVPIVSSVNRSECGTTLLVDCEAEVVNELSVCESAAFPSTWWAPTGH